MNKSSTILRPWLKQLGFAERKAPDFYIAQEFPSDHTYSYYLSELKSFGIDAVYCIDDIPTVLFKAFDSFDDRERLKELHKKLWNQSIAPVIILLTAKELRVYSNINMPAAEKEDLDSGNRLVKEVKRDSIQEINELNIHKFESGEFFKEHPSNFDPEQRVDRYLLKQIGAIRNKLLDKGLDDDVAYTLVGRSIFITYLCDRDVLTEDYFIDFKVKNYIELVSKFDTNLLFRFFNRLKNDFNGDIFPRENNTSYSKERQQINREHLKLLKDFLNGTEMESGQLGFWPFNFEYIPVELISGVYEQFLGAQKKAKRDTGSYYTPRFLADLVINTAFANVDVIDNVSVLDPSCGSGIFLVGAYRRIIEDWRARSGRRPSAKTLIRILKESIWGVDINNVACQIAAFSLYLTLLDYLKPRDIIELKSKGISLPSLVGKNIIKSDYFANNYPLASKKFDFIIGNPPWASASGEKAQFEKWCEENGYLISDRNIAQAFILKSDVAVKESGNVTLLLPAGLLFNHSEKHRQFVKKWLENYSISQVINLTDLRHYLFSDAIGPGIIVKHNEKSIANKNNYIEYISPKADPTWLKVELLPLATGDFKEISRRSLKNDPLIWKKAFWGTRRDIKLIQRLEDYENLSSVISARGWKSGRGYQKSGKDRKEYRQLIGKKEINNLSPYAIPDSSLQAMKKGDVLLHRQGVLEVYSPPHVLVSRGISSRYGKKGIISAFSKEYLIFKNSVTAISASKDEDSLLMFLTTILNSNIASYFFFHTSANFGVWHDEVRVSELFRLPFPIDRVSNRLIKRTQILMDELEKRKNDLLYNSTYFLNVEKQLNDIAYEFYDFTQEEKLLVEDTINLTLLSTQPSRRTKSTPLLKRCSIENIHSYIKTLTEALNYWLIDSTYKITGNAIESNLPFSIIKLTLAKQIMPKHSADESIEQIIKKVYKLIPNKVSRNLYLMRNLRIFDSNHLYIVKLNKLRDWTHSAALNDADEIFFDISAKETSSRK